MLQCQVTGTPLATLHCNMTAFLIALTQIVFLVTRQVYVKRVAKTSTLIMEPVQRLPPLGVYPGDKQVDVPQMGLEKKPMMENVGSLLQLVDRAIVNA